MNIESWGEHVDVDVDARKQWSNVSNSSTIINFLLLGWKYSRRKAVIDNATYVLSNALRIS